jgi:hypothetical protein
MTRLISTLLLVTFSLSQLGGCGFSNDIIGRQIYKDEAKKTVIPGWEVVKVKPGKRVELLLKNGDHLKGTLAGISGVPEEDYAKNYAEIRERRPGGVVLPKLGEEIAITDSLGKESTYAFLGFDHQYICVKMKNATKHTRILLTSVTRIEDSSANITEGETLRNVIGQGIIPFLSTHINLTIETSWTQTKPRVSEKETYTTRVPIDSVSQLAILPENYAKWRDSMWVVSAILACTGLALALRYGWDW